MSLDARRLSMLLVLLCPAIVWAESLLDHRLRVTLVPEKGRIEVTDQVTLPKQTADNMIHFQLHPMLEINTVKGGQLTTERAGHYSLTLASGQHSFTLDYSGTIREPLHDISDATGKSQYHTRGWIGPDGVFLDAGSAWYPLISDQPLRFDLEVSLPQGWRSVSQGRHNKKKPNHWQETKPQDEIYLLAGQYHFYEKQHDGINAEVYLRSNDIRLANRYLDATHRYLALYNELIGRYPYSKFALVENFWESGYGMPSFTLLGPQVIRLPFIIHTSYPHEILHNWFGNGVFVDYSEGNWSEGLTTYLADHYLREQKGTAANYRRDTLKSWTDHVRDSNDFPLKKFLGRHGDASQAVGYGKAMMFFHMIRKRIGDDAFFTGLRDFYQTNLFKKASYTDLRRSWEKSSGASLKVFFDQWLERTGAPRLAIQDISVQHKDGRYLLHATLAQQQQAAPFPLLVPVRITLSNGSNHELQVDLSEKRKAVTVELPAKPVQIAVDPEYDCFRQLYPEENPVTLSAIFGSDIATLIMPDRASPELQEAYQQLAARWQKKHPETWRIVRDDEIEALPNNGAIIILGWLNRWLPSVRERSGQPYKDNAKALTLGDISIDKEKNSTAFALGSASTAPILVVASNNTAAIPGLSRKLPHYGKYSLLIFSGNNPDIQEKKQWPAGPSPLKVELKQ